MNLTNAFRGKTFLMVLAAFFILGASNPRPNTSVEAAAWKTITIPATVCIPISQKADYYHSTEYVTCGGSHCAFNCPIQFPTELDVQVRRFSIMAFDNGSGFVQAKLYKNNPGNATAVLQATVKTSTTATNPQTRRDATIDSRTLTSYHGSNIRLIIEGLEKKVYGFRIKYSN